MSKFTLQLNQSYSILNFQNNEQQIIDAYSEPCQTFKIECLIRKVNTFQLQAIFANIPSQMFGRVLNMLLNCLSCFAMVLRGIHRKFDIWQTDYGINSKLRIFFYSEVIHESTVLKLRKSQQRFRNNEQLFNLIFFIFLSFFTFQCPRQ